MTRHLQELQKREIKRGVERLNQLARQANKEGLPVQFKGIDGGRPVQWTLYQEPFTWSDCYQYRPAPAISPMAMRLAQQIMKDSWDVEFKSRTAEDVAILIDEALTPHVAIVHQLVAYAWDVLVTAGLEPIHQQCRKDLRVVLNRFAPLSGGPYPEQHAFVPTLPPL